MEHCGGTFRSELILKCDLYRTDYDYQFTNLFFFRRTNQLVSSVKLAPDGMYEEKVPVFHGQDTSLYGFTGYIDRLEICLYSGYTWYEGYDQNLRYYARSRISRYVVPTLISMTTYSALAKSRYQGY